MVAPFIGRGHYNGSRPCPGRAIEPPNGVVTDDLGHVWAGAGHFHHSIDPHGGKGRVDELAYDPINWILYAENDGDTRRVS